MDTTQFNWAEQLSPKLLKSPWWIGHIPFAFELIGRQRPATIVELGTYSGSSFAAFCQIVAACGSSTTCYGIDLWEGDIHMGKFDETLFREISSYISINYSNIGVLIRKDFNEAANSFADGSVDLLHIDGTHTFEAVSNDFNTWLPKLSDSGIVLFHDVNVNMENTGPASEKFGVRKFFDGIKKSYPHFEFAHCWGLGVLLVGSKVTPAVSALFEMASDAEFQAYFARKGAIVSKQFDNMAIGVPKHAPYDSTVAPLPVWRRAVRKFQRIVARMR